jgi:CheY-like chemotaxis protein
MPVMDGHKAKGIIAGDPGTYGDPYIVALTANSDQVRRSPI